MKLVSWNVNGIRACITKGFYDVLKESKADIFCVQETKMQEGQIELEKHGYYTYMNSAEKKGYSGTLVFSKEKPLNYSYGIGIEEHWEDDFLAYLKSLEKSKPVILCGDLNVAHQEIDLKNPKTNRKNAGFSDEERAKMTNLLENGFIDTYRYLYPDQEGVYSWWSYRFNARKNNAGWRILLFQIV